MFYSHRRDIVKSFYRMPSVMLLGNGRTTMIKEITKREAAPHPKEEDFFVGYHKNGKTVQFAAPRDHPMKHGAMVRKMNGMNCKSMLYMFDVSPYSEPIRDQIRDFKRTQKALSNMSFILAANKTGRHDKEKLRHVRKAFGGIHEVSLDEGTGMEKLKDSIFASVKNYSE